jgi:hypothetical protein
MEEVGRDFKKGIRNMGGEGANNTEAFSVDTGLKRNFCWARGG